MISLRTLDFTGKVKIIGLFSKKDLTSYSWGVILPITMNGKRSKGDQ